MSTTHNEWADSMADWGMQHNLDRERLAYLNADYTKASRQEGADLGWLDLQDTTAWPARRGDLHVIDRLPEDWDDEPPKEPITPGESVLLCAIYCISAVLVVWLLVTAWNGWTTQDAPEKCKRDGDLVQCPLEVGEAMSIKFSGKK
jgi:hypothetical protein